MYNIPANPQLRRTRPLHYIAWTLIAMAAYAVMVILLKFSLRSIPPEAAVFVTNTFLVVGAFLWAIYRGVKITDHLGMNQPTLLLVISGLALTVAIVSQYVALSRGPVSTVYPLFGMNIAIVAVLGFLILSEPVSIQRIAGVILAAGAIFLLAR